VLYREDLNRGNSFLGRVGRNILRWLENRKGINRRGFQEGEAGRSSSFCLIFFVFHLFRQGQDQNHNIKR
jgi:hypothetical protein